MLERWSKENKETIADAVANRAYGGPNESPINWRYAFLAFMETAAIYLRDWNKVVEAVEALRDGKQEEAYLKLNESVANIDKVASLWGMRFQLFCDLIYESSSEHFYMGGPYCGAFYSQDPAAPFIGIAFKGTNPKNIPEVLQSVFCQLHSATNGNVYDTQVSTGVYNGLFGSFETGPPFRLIQKCIEDILKIIPQSPGSEVIIHVTGHSLGGSYSSICFTELTKTSELPPQTALGDLYTFGSPRNGNSAFANALRKHLGSHTGSSWRIVNDGDLVPVLPPQRSRLGTFSHVDTHYTIDDEKAPVKGLTEVDTTATFTEIDTIKTSDIVDMFLSFHYITSYYDAMRKALAS